jgi:hypothetical protein
MMKTATTPIPSSTELVVEPSHSDMSSAGSSNVIQTSNE